MHKFPIPAELRSATLADFVFTWRKSAAVFVDGVRVTPTLTCCKDTWNRLQAGEDITEVPASVTNISVHPDPDGSLIRALGKAIDAGGDGEALGKAFAEDTIARRARATAAILG